MRHPECGHEVFSNECKVCDGSFEQAVKAMNEYFRAGQKQGEIDALRGENDRLRQERDDLRKKVDALKLDNERLFRERSAFYRASLKLRRAEDVIEAARSLAEWLAALAPLRMFGNDRRILNERYAKFVDSLAPYDKGQ